AIDKAELPDRGVERPLVDELLHLVQRGLAPLEVELGCLLLKQRVEVGIAAISVGTALDHKGFEAGRGIAKGAAAAPQEIFHCFLGICLDKGCALEGPKPDADAHRLQIVEY